MCILWISGNVVSAKGKRAVKEPWRERRGAFELCCPVDVQASTSFSNSPVLVEIRENVVVYSERRL